MIESFQLSSTPPLCKAYYSRELLHLRNLQLPFRVGHQAELYKQLWFIYFKAAPLCIVSGWDGVHFPPAGLTGLFCALVAGKVLITHQYFGYCWAAGTAPALFAQPATAHQKLGVGQDPGWGRSWASWPKLTKGIDHAIWHQLKHSSWRERRRKGGICFLHCLPSGGTARSAEAMPREVIKHHLLMGSRE